MVRYLFRASCGGDQRQDHTERRSSLERALEAVAGKLETVAYAFGDTDVLAIAELPDEVSPEAFVSGVGAGGVVQVHHTVVISPGETTP